MQRSFVICLAVLIVCLSPVVAFSSIPAFPGAEGFGANSIGGRGGTIYQVTNLNDSGPGSLRAAVEAKGPRIVVFLVSGNIPLKSSLVITNPYITIAGQSAPGGGICLKDYPLGIAADHVIVRYIRVRPGAVSGQGIDALSISRGRDIIVDHCSTSWSVDECLSASTGGQLDNVTVQWCTITESLNKSVHNKGSHGYGSLIRGGWGNGYTFHHNFYAHHSARLPRPGNYNNVTKDPDGFIFDFRNNVIYNWGGSYAGYNADGSNRTFSITKMNFVSNYYKSGYDSRDNLVFSESTPTARAYFKDNCMNGNIPDDPWSLVTFRNFSDDQIKRYKQSSPIAVPDVSTDDALTAYRRVLADAGATFPERDAVDIRVINQMKSGTGKIINSVDDVGGWPELRSAGPPADSDRDGMPDIWEKSHNLNPDDASDSKGTDLSTEGYTNIEVYLNELVAKSPDESDSSFNSEGNDKVPAPMFSTFTSTKHPSKSGRKLGKLVYYEDFDDLNDWRYEGNLSASAKDGKLLIECGTRNEDRGNVWSVREFQTPFYFEFKFRKLSGRMGLNLIFWNARTVDGADFFSIPRGWNMRHVTDANMESYHISYCRGSSGITNFHKNPGFHDLVQDVFDPLANPGTDWHKIGIYQNGSHIMFFENGQLIHDIDEELDFEDKICLREDAHRSWSIKNELGTMCPGLDAKMVYTDEGEAVDYDKRKYTFKKPNPGRAYTYTSGRIGFRHQNGVTFYDDLRVWSLVPPQ